MKLINCLIKFLNFNDDIIINVDNDVQTIVEQFSNQSDVKLDASNEKKKLESEKFDSEFNVNDADFEFEKMNKS